MPTRKKTAKRGNKPRSGNRKNHPENSGRFKSDDPRRHTNGTKNADVVAFGKKLQNLLAQVGEELTEFDGRKQTRVEWLVENIWANAMNGKQWATELIFDRIAGKPKQAIDLNANVSLDSIDIVVHDDAASVSTTDKDGKQST